MKRSPILGVRKYFTNSRLVKRIAYYTTTPQFNQWLKRLALPLAAVLAFIVFNTLYNTSTGLTSHDLVRRGVATFTLGVLLFGPAVVMRSRIQNLYLGIVSAITGFLFIANTVYSGYAGGVLSASTLSYFWQAADTGGSVVALFKPLMLVYLLPSLIFFALAIFHKRIGRLPRFVRLKRRELLISLGGVAAIFLLGIVYVVVQELRQYNSLVRFTKSPFDSREVVRKVGIIGYNALDLIHYIDRKRSLTPDEVKYVEQQRATQVRPSGANAATGALAGRNVVFLQLESFQQFLIGKKINGQEITPNLNKLAAASRQFTNFNYVVGPGTSSDAEFVTFNSLMPLSNEAVVFDYPANSYQAYPKLLKDQGYATHAYHADSRNFWNRANTFPTFGFDEYTAEESYKTGQVIGFGLNDKDFFAQTADMMQQLPQPFYSHVNTLSSHTPFHMPDADRKLNLDGLNLNWIQTGYLESANYTDAGIGEFLDKLGKEGLADKLALVIMGDHEGFIFQKDDKEFAKFMGYPGGFNDLSYLNSRTIPFMIYAPGAVEAATDDRPASQMDIYPTLVNLLGIQKPRTVLGVDLMGDQEPITVRRERGPGPNLEMVRRGDLTFIEHSMDGKRACYRGEERQPTSVCKDLEEFAIARAITSDYVIQGNRIDLLKTP